MPNARGSSVSGQFNHRGVMYSVESLGEQRWRWEVSPPKSMRGLKNKIGEIKGDQADAIRAAHKAIEAQVGRH